MFQTTFMEIPVSSEYVSLPDELDSFNAIVLKHQDSLFRTALHILGSEQSAFDATQDAFISAYKKLSQFKGGSLKAWLTRIVINKSYDILRTSKRHPILSLDELPTDYQERISVLSLDDLSSPMDIAENNDLQQTIEKCLEKLTVPLRTVLVLVDINEMSYEETASALGIPVGTVKSRLARARVQMQGLLKLSGVSAQ